MPNCSSSRSAICQHLPDDRTVQSCRFYTSRPTVILRYSDIKVVTPTSTSVSDVVEHESFPSQSRSTAALHFHTLSLTPTCPNTAQQSPRTADTTRHRHRVRYRVTSPTSPTSRPTRRRSRDTATTVDHGDAAVYQRRRLVASTRDAASHQCRRFAATGQGHRATHFTRRYLLYIYCLLIRSAKNLISLLLKNRLFNSLPHAICMHDHNVVITLSINCRDDCSSDRYLSSRVLEMQ